MVVQAVNTGGDLGNNHFDIAVSYHLKGVLSNSEDRSGRSADISDQMPGGGVGLFNGCTTQWGAPPNGWGAQYGGISSNTCHEFPQALQAGCNWRFSWFQNADNPR
jgi:hypothetical protein